MGTLFDAHFSDTEDFSSAVETDSTIDAQFENAETFGASLEESTETFTASFDDESQMNADFGLHQMIDPSKVTSVNGMVGDVVIDNPYINSVELVGNKTFGQLGVHIMTNMELEELLT